MAIPDDERQESRPPTIDDLVKICKRLNEEGAKYIIIGGFAINYYGYPRATVDIDLLIEPSNENIFRIKTALSVLPDNAVKELTTSDIEKYEVVRVVDEIVVDLLKRTYEITYKNAIIEYYEFKGVTIPIADLSTLIKTKENSIRPKDKEDLLFLRTVEKEEQKNTKNL